MYETHLCQEIPQQQDQEYSESYVFEVELSTSYQSDIPITHPSTSPVVNSDCALSEFIEHEERCSKFINQDLNFLQPSNIPSVSKNMLHDDNSSVQVSQSQTQVVSSTAKLPLALLIIKTQLCQHKYSSLCWNSCQLRSKGLRLN